MCNSTCALARLYERESSGRSWLLCPVCWDLVDVSRRCLSPAVFSRPTAFSAASLSIYYFSTRLSRFVFQCSARIAPFFFLPARRRWPISATRRPETSRRWTCRFSFDGDCLVRTSPRSPRTERVYIPPPSRHETLYLYPTFLSPCGPLVHPTRSARSMTSTMSTTISLLVRPSQLCSSLPSTC